MLPVCTFINMYILYLLSKDELFFFSRQRGQGKLWEEVIYPGMRQAIVYTLECCQLSLEARKVS
jgi:hypothetical protein